LSGGLMYIPQKTREHVRNKNMNHSIELIRTQMCE
jgi:hypothetical protein